MEKSLKTYLNISTTKSNLLRERGPPPKKKPQLKLHTPWKHCSVAPMGSTTLLKTTLLSL